MQEPDIDQLAGLEDRIRRAVDLVASLRSERDAALEQRDAAHDQRDVAHEQRDAAHAEAAKLRAELQAMDAERKQVRTRIEKLLGQLDQL